MGSRGRNLLGLVGMKAGRDDNDTSASGMSEGTKAKDGDGDEGKRAAVEDLHAAMNAEGGPDHDGMVRALEDFHDLHMASRKGGES